MQEQNYELPRLPTFDECSDVITWSLKHGLCWVTPSMAGNTAIVRSVGRKEADEGWQKLTHSMVWKPPKQQWPRR